MSLPTPVTCPSWEYEDFPNCDQLLLNRTRSALHILASLSADQLLVLSKDTRTAHAQYFRGLVPPETPYYAGHYRGENFVCLRNYEVQIPSDPRVGHSAQLVAVHMAGLAADITDAMRQCDVSWPVPNAVFARPQKLAHVVSVAAAIFVYFLEIHPYANGNGHAARLLLICVLLRFGVFLRSWEMHPRPPDPPYTAAIASYRSGDHGPLERFILSCI